MITATVRYPENTIVIQKAGNGFILTIRGNREATEDNLTNGEYIFTNINSLAEWLTGYINNYDGVKEGSEKLKFMECAACSSKLGSPVLCKSCFNNRQAISDLEAMCSKEDK